MGRRTVAAARGIARITGSLLAVLALAAASLWLVAGTPWGRDRIARRLQLMLAREGVTATFRARLELPLRLVLEDVRIRSPSDARAPPALEAPRIVLRLGLSTLLCGRLEASSVDADAPRLRVVLTRAEGAPTGDRSTRARQILTGRWPVRKLTVRGGSLELAWGSLRATASGLRIEANAGDIGGSLRVRIAGGHIEEPGNGGSSYHDALCELDASGRIGARDVQIDYVDANGVADLDHGITPCGPPDAPGESVTVRVDAGSIELDSESRPAIYRGHVLVRAPLGLLDRVAPLPQVQGWANIEADVRFVAGSRLPEGRGTVRAHDVKVRDFRVARAIEASVVLKNDVLQVPSADVDTTTGPLHLSDVVLRPLISGVPLRGRLDGGALRFDEFLRAIQVARHPHVRWAIEALHWDEFEGTLWPLALSGRLGVQTGTFGVFDAACDVERCSRIWGFARSFVRARATLTSRAFELDDVRATLTGGDAEATRVVIGFHDELSVDRGRARLSLTRTSPLASLSIGGELRADARVFGRLGDPVVTFSGTIDGFVLAGDPLGDVTSVAGRYGQDVLRFEGVRAHKGASLYEVPSLRIAFGGNGRLAVDAIAVARELHVQDLLSLVRLDEQPSFATLGGSLIDARARVRFVRGGPEDATGQGTIFVNADAALSRPSAFGQGFDEGTVGVDVRIGEPAAGPAAVDVDVRTLALRDHGGGVSGDRGGSIVASGRLQGGTLQATAVAVALPLSRLVKIANLAPSIRGRVSGVAHAAGTLEALGASADLEVTPVQLGLAPFGPSSLHIDAALGMFAPARITARGSLLGGEVDVNELVVDGTGLRGRASLHALRVDPLLQGASSDATGDAGMSEAVHALLSGDLTIEKLDPRDIAHAQASFVPTELTAAIGEETARLRPTGAALVLAHDSIELPPLHIDVNFPERHVVGSSTGAPRLEASSGSIPGHPRSFSATLRGSVTALSRKPQVDLALAAPRVDLALLVGVVPDLTRAEGTLSGVLTVKGPVDGPALGGHLRARATTASFSWIPRDLGDVDIDVAVSPRDLRVVRASATLGDGRVEVTGGSTMTGALPGVADLALRARNVRLGIATGIDAAFDADARVLVDMRRLLRGGPHAVSVTGDVGLDGLTYRRSLGSAVSRPRERGPEYDPSRDLVDLALRLHARAPVEVEDDVASLRLLPAGEFWLRGTNQRPSLDGRLASVGFGKIHVQGIGFDVSRATLDFDDPTSVSPRVDVVATTEYRRVTAFEAPLAFTAYGSRGAQAWRIWLKASGGEGDLRVELTSDPPLSQADIVLLLALGVTRPELDAMQATVQLQASAGLEVLAGIGGAERIVRGVVPIDEVRFGGTYSPLSLVIVPEVTLGKRIGERLAATVTSTLAYQRIVGGTISWWLGSNVWFEALWENVTPVPVYPVGDFGVGVRWRFEL